MEAARIPWRPLGRLLVEQGLLTDDELELALAKQEQTGKRLGETIVDCGFVSGPELSSALASQYGIDLQTESGFGTGLRSQIQRRHESERGRVVRPTLVAVADLTEAAAVEEQEPTEVEPDEEREAVLLAQLEEQWAKLAAAEAKLADHELELSNVERDHGRRRAQVARFVRRIRVQDERLRQSQQDLHDLTEVAEKLLAQVEELSSQVRSRDEELERLREVEAGLAERERGAEERGAEIVRLTEELHSRQEDLDDLTGVAERRLVQVEELSTQVRSRDEELERLREVEAGLAERERGAKERGAEIVRLTEELRSRQEDLGDLTGVAERRLVQVEELSTQVRSRDERIERLIDDVRGCDEEIERLRDQVEELSTQVRSRDEQIERLIDDVRGCDEEIERLRDQVDPVPEPSVDHLVLVQLADRYELVERAGSPPRHGAELELPELCEGSLVVAGSGRSPLPGDTRPCAFAQRCSTRVRSS